MTKKQLTTKLTDYRTQLDKAAEREMNMRAYIEHLETEVEKVYGLEKQLNDRLEFEQLLVEIFTKVIKDYQGE